MGFKIQTIAAGAVVFFSASAGGQTPSQSPPPCTDDIFRQFDFWVGEWEVFTPDGKKAGENSIKIEENGCLLVERWKSANGGTGQSYNYVDLATNKWRQIWVANWGTIDYSGGLNDAGAMALEGSIAYPSGVTNPFRGEWKLNADGTVTQSFWQYDAEKDDWPVWFVGSYKKKPSN